MYINYKPMDVKKNVIILVEERDLEKNMTDFYLLYIVTATFRSLV